jgi:hypothetical protein
VAYGVDLHELSSQVADGLRRAKSQPEDLLLPGLALGVIDLATVEDPNFEGISRWTSDASLMVDGFSVWFEADLTGGEHFSSASGPEQTVHGCLYAPLREPLAVPARAELSFRFCAVQVSGAYAWTWECAVADRDSGKRTRTPRQSSLGALATTRARLAARSELHRPVRGVEGRRWLAALDLMDGGHTSREIAAALAALPAAELAAESAAFEWLQHALQVLESGDVEEL